MQSSRLLLVSNRLPVTVKLSRQQVTLERSAGGLATGLLGPHEASDGLWIGWPGEISHFSPAQRAEADARLREQRLVPVHLTPAETKRYYEGFSNGVLWPLFHYLLDRVPIESRDWDVYRKVNERFADQVSRHARPGDIIWVHDYQLMLVPELLRRRVPGARIGFFLHIPFPSSEVFCVLPWREELLRGMLGADIIGFHTLAYVRHFATSLLRVLGVDADIDHIQYQNREVFIDAFPMGIDAQAFDSMARTPEVRAEAASIRRLGTSEHLLVGIDRLDYTKGIPRRLVAFERLLEREPQLRHKLRFIQVTVPSREAVAEYEAFRRKVHELVGRINGMYATNNNIPVHYLFRSLGPAQVTALYRAANVMLVTPLRDGMNLVAKEFVASRCDNDGVLVLSEFAGAAAELAEALIVNPYNVAGMATTMKRAITMPEEERKQRMSALRARVLGHDVHQWVASFLEALNDLEPAHGPESSVGVSPPETVDEIRRRILAAPGVLLLLDYDGTLVPFAATPDAAAPDAELHMLIRALAARPEMRVCIVSGRDRSAMEAWFGDLPVGLYAEHGLWMRPSPDKAWYASVPLNVDWKPRVRRMLDEFVKRVPGSLIEEKTASLAWHYRQADPELGAMQARELRLHASQMLIAAPVESILGEKVVEIRMVGVNKGRIVPPALAAAEEALPVALGDDRTDELLFAAMPPNAICIHVGSAPSRAQYRLKNPAAARAFLQSLCEPREGPGVIPLSSAS